MDMLRVHIATLAVDDTPLPEFLYGLLPESLVELSWTDPSLEVNEYGWWLINKVETPFDPNAEEVTGYAYTPDVETSTVTATPIVEPLAPEVITARIQMRKGYLIQLIAAARRHAASLTARANALEQAAVAATTLAAVNAIEEGTGWPVDE